MILGIDEVGRGPWAGPLVVSAVILGDAFKELPEYELLADSKKLSEKRRQLLNQVVLEKSAATGLGWVNSRELDKYKLSASLRLATRRAVKQILTKKIKFDQIIIDGTGNFLIGTPLEDMVSVLPKGDALVKEISAASIIAKVARDNYMKDLANIYPEYGFEKHVGYGTKIHKEALLNFGPCTEHRFSFRPISEINQEFVGQSYKEKPYLNTGNIAEQQVAEYLDSIGHTVVELNHKTKTYEIDIISIINKTIYFTEVKYSRDSKYNPLDRITQRKQQRMTYAVTNFINQNPKYADFAPILAAASVIGDDFEVKDWFTLGT